MTSPNREDETAPPDPTTQSVPQQSGSSNHSYFIEVNDDLMEMIQRARDANTARASSSTVTIPLVPSGAATDLTQMLPALSRSFSPPETDENAQSNQHIEPTRTDASEPSAAPQDPPLRTTTTRTPSALQPTNKTNTNSRGSYLDAAQSVAIKSSPRLSVQYGVSSRPPRDSQSTHEHSVKSYRTNTDSRSASRSRSRPMDERDIFARSTSSKSNYSGRCSYCNGGTHSQWRHCVNCSHRLVSTSNEAQPSHQQQSTRTRRPRQSVLRENPVSDTSVSPLTQLPHRDLIGEYASVEYPESIIEATECKFGTTSYSDPVLARQSGLTHNEKRQIKAYVARSQRQPANRRQYLQRTMPHFLPLDTRTVPLPSIKSAGHSAGVPVPLPSISDQSDSRIHPCTQSSDAQKQKNVADGSTLSEIHANQVQTMDWTTSSSSARQDSCRSASSRSHDNQSNANRATTMTAHKAASTNSKTKTHTAQQSGDDGHSSADQAVVPLVLRPSSVANPEFSGVSLRCMDTDSDIELELELDSDSEDETESSSSQRSQPKSLPLSYWFDEDDTPNYADTITAAVPASNTTDLYDNGEHSNNALTATTTLRIPPLPSLDDDGEAHNSLDIASSHRIPPLPPVSDLDSTPDTSPESQPPDLQQFAFQQPTVPRTARPQYVDHSQGASQPLRAQICPTLSGEALFIEKIRTDGVFGDPINVTEMNSVLYYLLNQVTNNSFGFKKWVSGRETNRSLADQCKFGPTHRKCVQKRNHLSCVHDQCGEAYRRWLANPDSTTEAKLFDQAGNNDRLLLHVRRKHPTVLRQARNLLLFYIQDDDMRATIATILAPLRKTQRPIKRKLAIRPGFDDQQHVIIPRTPTTSAAAKAMQRKRVKQQILRLWTKPIIQIHTNQVHFSSVCRSGVSPHEHTSCDLKRDGSEPRRKIILLWNRFRYSALQRYKCRTHPNMRRLSADHPDIFIRAPDQLTIGLLRIGSTLLTPSFAMSAIKLYVKNQQNIEAVRTTIIENWKQTYRDESNSTDDAQILHDVLNELCPAINTMRIIIRTLLLVVYVRIKFELTQLLFERTPLGFGEDQTWNRLAKVVLANGELQTVGLHTVTETLGCLVRYGFLNNHSEDHYQKVCLLTDVKALQLLYGNLETLRSCPTVWGSDNIKSNVNLPAKIQAELAKQLDSNPKYQPLKDKLAANEFDIKSLIDIADECQLHKFRRTYKALKDDGLSPKKHGDFELVTQAEIWIINSIQYGGSTINEAVPYCGRSTHADGKWLTVFEFEWEQKEYLADKDNDQQICDLLHQYLQLDGIHSVSTRNEKLEQFKASQSWSKHSQVLQSWATSVHPFYRGQVLGRWINKERQPKPQWIQDVVCFADIDNEVIKVTRDHVSQYIVDIILRLFRINIGEYQHAPMLRPVPRFLQWLYHGIIDPLHHKIRELETHEHTHPIMEYTHTAKQLKLAVQDISVEGAANSRQEDMVGVWKNVNNERFHQTNRTQKRKISPNQRVEYAVIELDVELVEFNITKLDHIIADRPELFDADWLHKFDALKSRLIEPDTMKDVEQQRYCLNLSDVLEDHVKACNAMMTIRDISYKHKRFLTKKNRYNLARDLYVFKDQIRTISVDALGTFAMTYNVSIIPIIKEMQRAGLTADKFDDGQPITAPQSIPKVRDMIDKGQFTRITMKLDSSLNLSGPPNDPQDIQPMPIEFASAAPSPNNPFPLPSIAPSQSHHLDDDSANIGDFNISLLPTFKTLTTVFNLFNEFNDHCPVLLNLVHAINMAQYTLQDFIHALFDASRVNVVYNNIFTDYQVKAITIWANKPSIQDLLLGMIRTTDQKIEHLSYQKRHGTVQNPQCVAMNVLGNDATKNAKYASANKKRRITEIEDEEEDDGKPAKKKGRANGPHRNTKQVWQPIFKMNSNEIRLKAALKQCECKYEEVHLAKRTAPAQKFKCWANPTACLAEIQSETVTSLRRGGAIKMKHFACLHGWKKNTPFGNVKEYAMDFIIMHCVYGVSAEAFHAMKRVDIINQYQRNWKSKKPVDGRW